VKRAVKSGGKLFMVDSRRQNIAGAKDRKLQAVDDIYHIRQLNDGQKFKVIKIYYTPEELKQRFSLAGFNITATFTENYFVYAKGSRVQRNI